MAALSAFYKGVESSDPMTDPIIKMLYTALIKSGTKCPAQRTPVMPVTPFFQLFNSWNTSGLSIKLLRLRAITLLALCLMARPSDLAPKGVHFDPVTMSARQMDLSIDQVSFHNDGSMTITFFGIKNDHDRSGFEVRLPGVDNPKVDPVRCLKVYIERTTDIRTKHGSKAIFIQLCSPFQGIGSNTISKILEEAIALAGLSGFTARSFRPTGATAAMAAGVHEQTAMQIGRWKSCEIFRDRYVYPFAKPEYSNNILKFQGVTYK